MSDDSQDGTGRRLDRQRALAALLRALRNGDPTSFADAVSQAVAAGAGKSEIDQVLAHAFRAASDYPPAKKPFDPHEISDAFVQVLDLR
jgi:hypothetical protein